MPYVAISRSSSGAVVAPITGRNIRVLSYTLANTTAQTVQFTDSDGTALTGAMPLATNGNVSPNSTLTEGLFQTASGKGLNIVLGGATAVGGHLTYQVVAGSSP